MLKYHRIKLYLVNQLETIWTQRNFQTELSNDLQTCTENTSWAPETQL